MDINYEIVRVKGREILDSRGNPTVEAEVELECGAIGRAAVPSGASTGKFEAVELRDGGGRYLGKGVKKAVEHINTKLADAVMFENAMDQKRIDHLLCEADGTENKEKLGANAILAVSLATARAAAAALDIPLYRYLGGIIGHELPVPMMNILNGGKHADNTVDLQEFMIMPAGAANFAEGLRMCAEIYHTLKSLLKADGYSTAIGDEGGFAPNLKNSEEVLSYMVKAIRETGYEPGTDVKIAIDAAASELYEENSGMYFFPGESEVLRKKEKREYDFKVKDTTVEGVPDTKNLSVMRSTMEMISLYEELCARYPIYSIEDGLNEEDWEGWRELTKRLGNKVQLVGDDLFVTNTHRLEKGIKCECGNSILIKLNQIGSVSETLEAIQMAHKAGYTAIVSHRSGETEDTTIADLAVALNTCQIKTGAPSRSERVAKYNQLLRIESELGNSAVYPQMDAFHVKGSTRHV